MVHKEMWLKIGAHLITKKAKLNGAVPSEDSNDIGTDS